MRGACLTIMRNFWNRWLRRVVGRAATIAYRLLLSYLRAPFSYFLLLSVTFSRVLFITF